MSTLSGRLRRSTALLLVFAVGGLQPLFAAVPEGSAEQPVNLPDAPGEPLTPSFPGVVAQAAGALGPSAPKALHIVILEGDGALNNIRARDAREPIVQIEDENHKPVASASVTFLIHGGANGAGGSFGAVGSTVSPLNTISVTTDARGRAVGRDFHPNQTKGQYTIEVLVVAGVLAATALIHETNVVGEGGGGATLAAAAVDGTGAASTDASQVGAKTRRGVPRWAIIGGVIAAAAAVVATTVVLANQSKGATITPGTGTVTP